MSVLAISSVFIIIALLLRFWIDSARKNRKMELEESQQDVYPITAIFAKYELSKERSDTRMETISSEQQYQKKSEIRKISSVHVEFSEECNPDEAKVAFWNVLRHKQFSLSNLLRLIEKYESGIQEQSITLSINGKETSTVSKIEWVKEFVSKKLYKERSRNSAEVNDDFIVELTELIGLKDKRAIDLYLNQNPKVMDTLAEEHEYKDMPFMIQYNKAKGLINYERKYDEALEIINHGLKYSSSKMEFQFHALRSKCYMKLNRLTDAIDELTELINITISEVIDLNKNSEILSELYIDRAEMYKRTGLFRNEEMDLKLALTYLDQYINNPKNNDSFIHKFLLHEKISAREGVIHKLRENSIKPDFDINMFDLD